MSSSSDEGMFEMDFEPPSSSEGIPMHHEATCNILEAVLRPSTEVEMAIHERAMKHVTEIGEERERSSLKKRLMMRLRKDGYDASLCMSSWVATSQHPGGGYEYIDVVVAAEGGAGTTSRLVVDIDFRSQFQVARPAAWYAHLWSQLPPVFVGPRGKLRKAVSLLCAAAQRSLRESGLQVPPWRKSSYMHAKWLPSGMALPAGGTLGGAAAVAQWSVGKERSCGPRRSGGLSMELSGSTNAGANGCQAGSIWA